MPHPEVNIIKVNSILKDFSYQLKNGDNVEVFPFQYGPYASELGRPSFVLDVHLGKLAKYLRMMGFDSLYKNDYSDKELISISCNDRRVLLTRDLGVLKYRCVQYGYWVRAISPFNQIKEISEHYRLCFAAAPLSRCIECNGELMEVEKSKIAFRLEAKTLKYFDKFTMCKNCSKIYWQGSHIQKINGILKQICQQFK